MEKLDLYQICEKVDTSGSRCFGFVCLSLANLKNSKIQKFKNLPSLLWMRWWNVELIRRILLHKIRGCLFVEYLFGTMEGSRKKKGKRKNNTVKNYFATIVNFQGFPKHKCVYQLSVHDYVYVPPNYQDVARPNLLSKFCRKCLLTPCLASFHYTELCGKIAKLLMVDPAERVSTLVVSRRCETMMKGYMRKYFGAKYTRDTGLPQCVYEALRDIIPYYEARPLYKLNIEIKPVDEERKVAIMETAVEARRLLGEGANLNLEADSSELEDSSLPSESDSEEETEFDGNEMEFDGKVEEEDGESDSGSGGEADSDSASGGETDSYSVEAAPSIDGSLVGPAAEASESDEEFEFN